MSFDFSRVFLVSGALVSLAACQPGEPLASAPAPAHPAAALSLAQGACGGCHSVEAYSISPNPASPAFEDIANRPGLTRETLTTWLRDAHNYPEEMDFWIEGGEAELLVTHILSLQREGYEPPIQ